MKIEKRGNSGFISHEGLTVFFNKYATHYTISVQKAEQRSDGQRVWLKVGTMTVEKLEFKQLQQVLASLV
jgi:hypothetical protein